MSASLLRAARPRTASIYEVFALALFRLAGRDFCGKAPLPGEATAAAPGSEAKLLAMRRRYLRRQQLHHPGDFGSRVSGDRIVALAEPAALAA